MHKKMHKKYPQKGIFYMAELTGLEPVTSAVTGQRSKPTELQLQIFLGGEIRIRT
jgi:hypothetical protein